MQGPLRTFLKVRESLVPLGSTVGDEDGSLGESDWARCCRTWYPSIWG